MAEVYEVESTLRCLYAYCPALLLTADTRLEDSEIIHFKLFGSHVIVLNSSRAQKELLEKRSAIYSDRYGHSCARYGSVVSRWLGRQQTVMMHEL